MRAISVAGERVAAQKNTKTPVEIDGRSLVDGALTEPVPVIAARDMGTDIVIGVDVAFRPGEDQFQGLIGVAF